MRVLVTGGCGFIGGTFVRHIFENRRSWTIDVIDNLTYAGSRDNIPSSGVNLQVADICNVDFVGELYYYDWVVHFAAESHVDRSIDCPRPFFRTNIDGTINILEGVRENKIKMLHISSSEVYGEGLELTPKSPLYPKNPYAASKAAGDLLVQSYRSTYGIHAYIVRPFNNYGPRQHKEKVIPCFINQALQGKPITVHGDGRATRDFVYVEDVARELVKLIEQAPYTPPITNIGSGQQISVNDIAEAVQELIPCDIIHVDDRPGQVHYQSNGASIRGNSIDWKEGIRRTVEWYRHEYKNLQ